MSQKGFASIVLVVVVVILVGVVGYFAFVKKSEPIAQQPTPTPALKDETSSWKTYTNAQYGFEFKYPKELYLVVNSHGDGGLITISDKKNWETEGERAILVISLNAATFPVEESNTGISEKNFPITELEKKLNLAIKSNFQGDPPWGWFNISIPLKDESKFLNFNIRISSLDDVGYGGNNKYIKLAGDILSTFEFTATSNKAVNRISALPTAPSLSADHKSIAASGKVIMSIDDEAIFSFFKDKKVGMCDENNIDSTPTRKAFCTDKSMFKSKSRFSTIVSSPDNKKIGFSIETDELTPDSVVGIFYPFNTTYKVHFLTNYYLGNQFISFSPTSKNFVFRSNCFEGDCGLFVKDSNTLADKISFGNTPDHSDYSFVKWISDKEIEYKDTIELKRASF
jgi:hypothetical protein